MPLRTLSPRIAVRRTLALVLVVFASWAAPMSANTNSPAGALSPSSGGRPLVLFRPGRWYPMRPPAEAPTEILTLVVLLAIPTLTFVALRVFFRRTKARGQPIGWGGLVCGNGLLFVFLLSTLLLLGEVWFRFFVDTTDSLGFTKISERWVSRHWQRNAAGCRDNIEYAPIIASGKRRLTFLGDSFAAGHGIKDVEARFANRLRARHPEWEVHLLANVGLDTRAEIDVVRKAAAQGYQFDEVVLVYCLNDVCDLLMAPGQPFEGRLPALEQTAPWFTRGSYFLDLFYNRYKAAQNPYVKDYFAFVKAGYRGDYWQAQQKRLKELRDLVQRHGGHLSVVTFPFLHALGPQYDHAFAHDALHRWWTKLQVAHLDLLPCYAGLSSGELTVNAHDAHPNELANQLAADAINRRLWPAFTNRVQTVGSAVLEDK